MRSYRKELWFSIPSRRAFINITPHVVQCVEESGIREGLVLVNSTTYTGPFRIWAIGYADGVRQGYSYNCLPYNGPSEGTATRGFGIGICTSETIIDTVEFLMVSDDRLEVLVDFYVPVQHTFIP